MTGSQCVVAFCKSNALLKKKTGEKFSLHKFPKEEQLRNKWVRFCRREKNFNPDASRICSKHFTKEDYENSEVESSIKGLLNMEVKKRLRPTGIFCSDCCLEHNHYFQLYSAAYPTVLQLKMENENEFIEVICEQLGKNSHYTPNSLDHTDIPTNDMQIVSQKDVESLRNKYSSLNEEHENLQKKYTKLEELNRKQIVQIERLEKKVFGLKRRKCE